jgi:molybdopterin converting factor small subunit
MSIVSQWLYGIIHYVQDRHGRTQVEVEDFEEGVMYRFRGHDHELQHGDRVTFLPEAKTWRGRRVTKRVLMRI